MVFPSAVTRRRIGFRASSRLPRSYEACDRVSMSERRVDRLLCGIGAQFQILSSDRRDLFRLSHRVRSCTRGSRDVSLSKRWYSETCDGFVSSCLDFLISLRCTCSFGSFYSTMVVAKSFLQRAFHVAVTLLLLLFFFDALASCAGVLAKLSLGSSNQGFRTHWMMIPAKPLSNRKLLQQGPVETVERIGEDCSKDDVVIIQGATSPLPSGIPTYTVQVLNTCVAGADGAGCSISDVHVSCGWFSSARLVNPRVFRRVGFDDCLVNDGRSILAGSSVSFEYANSFPYRLFVSSASCSSSPPRS